MRVLGLEMAAVGLAILAAGAGCQKEDKRAEERIEALQREVNQLKAQLRTPPLGPSDQVQAMAKVEQKLTTQFNSEQHDEGRSQTVKERLSKALPTRASLETDCRATLCLLKATFPDETAFRDFTESALLGVKALWQGSFQVAHIEPPPVNGPGQPGTRTVTFFLGNEPQNRPHPPVPEPCCQEQPKAPNRPSPHP